jgi:hypothetical protein
MVIANLQGLSYRVDMIAAMSYLVRKRSLNCEGKHRSRVEAFGFMEMRNQEVDDLPKIVRNCNAQTV